MNLEELRREYDTYSEVKHTNPEQALSLNYELYEYIFEILGSLGEQESDIDYIGELNIPKKMLGEYLLMLCNEAEVFRLNIQLNQEINNQEEK